MKEIRGLTKRIDYIKHGQLLGMSFGLQSQYNAYRQQHLMESKSEYGSDEDGQDNDIDAPKDERQQDDHVDSAHTEQTCEPDLSATPIETIARDVSQSISVEHT